VVVEVGEVIVCVVVTAQDAKKTVRKKTDATRILRIISFLPLA
jgi:hypothetical protein